MLIKVYNIDTTEIETIESSKLDVKKHFHRNTKEAFTKEDLENLKVKTTKEA